MVEEDIVTLVDNGEIVIPTSDLACEVGFLSKFHLAVVCAGSSFHLIDLETATLLHTATFGGYQSVRLRSISPCGAMLFRFNPDGQVGEVIWDYWRVVLRESELIPYIRKEFPHDRGLAMGVAGRTDLPGAEDLWARYYPN